MFHQFTVFCISCFQPHLIILLITDYWFVTRLIDWLLKHHSGLRWLYYCILLSVDWKALHTFLQESVGPKCSEHRRGLNCVAPRLFAILWHPHTHTHFCIAYTYSHSSLRAVTFPQACRGVLLFSKQLKAWLRSECFVCSSQYSTFHYRAAIRSVQSC